MTREEEDAVLAQAKAIEKERTRIYIEASDANIARVESGNPPFVDAELRYAATARCKCGAGFAYPDAPFIRGMWACSALLKSGDRTQAEADKHDGALPFSMYEVKSEKQPSAGGRTTRPSAQP